VHHLSSQLLRRQGKAYPYCEEQGVEWLGQELVLLPSAYPEDGGSGKGVYLLCSEMSALDYLMEVPHSYVTDDANVLAFEEVAKIIGGCNAV
jgi:hypothetical protein